MRILISNNELRKLSKNICLAAVLFLIPLCTLAQNVKSQKVSGMVMDQSDMSLLYGVTVRVLPTNQIAQTDEKGNFELRIEQPRSKKLVLSFLGMNTDTVSLESWNGKPLHLHLSSSDQMLGEVAVMDHMKSMNMDLKSLSNKQNVNSRELLKAACCNLSESFETIPSVDVGFTDAISGYKQIRLLGLVGANTALTRENIPDARGLASVTGLTFTPGVWVESMQVSKGSGSVVNGYEGVAGQINVEWWKPFMANTPKWYINAYQDARGRSEGNVLYNHAFNDGLSTGLYLSGSQVWNKNDENKDGFLDDPLGTTFTGTNRWMWFGENGLDIQGGVKGVYMDRTGGQLDFDKHKSAGNQTEWGYHQQLKRIEAWAKIGKVYKDLPYKSLGLQLSGVYHQQNSRYGLRDYDAKERNFYSNFIYQTIIGTTDHIIKTGASFNYRGINEQFVGTPYDWKEAVPGAFVEYNYSYLEKFGASLGLRGDHSSLYGFFVTPRLHLRYTPTEGTVLRASAGRAQRTVTVFAENMGYLASSREFILEGNSAKGAYGFKPEKAWNIGLNLIQKFMLNYRDGSIAMDYYYTDFQDKVVTDMESPREVKFYNLDGRSYAHSFQVQLDYEPVRRWETRLAYRYFLIKTAYQEGIKKEPLFATQRAFLNTGYHFDNQWKLDYTLTWNGKKRIPSHFLAGNEVESHDSPSFIQMNFQVSKSWKDGNLEWYLGAENLTNYMQKDLILDADHPFGPDFDASMVWGPGMGRNFYMGIRWKIF